MRVNEDAPTATRSGMPRFNIKVGTTQDGQDIIINMIGNAQKANKHQNREIMEVISHSIRAQKTRERLQAKLAARK